MSQKKGIVPTSQLTPMQRYTAACNYPGVLDPDAVERHLLDYCKALGVTRKVVRLERGWSLAQHPSLARYIDRVIDDLEKRNPQAAQDARAAQAARAAQDARAARAARAAQDARDAPFPLHRFTAWCMQSAGWWWRFEMSWIATTYIGALQTKESAVQHWSEPFFEAFLAGAWILHWTDDTLYWVAKPRVHVDRSNGARRLHNPSGPALESDCEDLYFLDGIMVPSFVVERPDLITIQHIEGEENAEVRRKMLERYGWSRYIKDCGAKVVDECPHDHAVIGLRGARLLLKELPDEPEPIVYLDMINSTPEPDGTLKHYLERIDPKMYDGDAGKFCHAAMASRWMHRNDQGELVHTFNDWRQYTPTFES